MKEFLDEQGVEKLWNKVKEHHKDSITLEIISPNIPSINNLVSNKNWIYYIKGDDVIINYRVLPVINNIISKYNLEVKVNNEIVINKSALEIKDITDIQSIDITNYLPDEEQPNNNVELTVYINGNNKITASTVISCQEKSYRTLPTNFNITWTGDFVEGKAITATFSTKHLFDMPQSLSDFVIKSRNKTYGSHGVYGEDEYVTKILDGIIIDGDNLFVNGPYDNEGYFFGIELIFVLKYYKDFNLEDIPNNAKYVYTNTLTGTSANENYSKIIVDETGVNVYDEINYEIELFSNTNSPNCTKLNNINLEIQLINPEKLYIKNNGALSSFNTGIGNFIVKGKSKYDDTLIFTLSASVNIYNLKPCCFIIDQRGEISDPDTMVSERFNLNSDGSKIFTNTSWDLFAWLRNNSHAFIGNCDTNGIMTLKQLNDNNRTKFINNQDSANYINEIIDNYDIWMKFGSDIYYKTEAYIPEDEDKPNEDYVFVTFAKEIPEGQNESNWEKWDKNTLIGVYESYIDTKGNIRSISNVRPNNNITQLEFIQKAKARGDSYNICTYDVHKFINLLFYGYYRSLNSQEICGYGTEIRVNNEGTTSYYPVPTGKTDNLCMTDTTILNGGDVSENYLTNDVIAGNDSLKSINFWGLENWWGNTDEFLDMWSVKVFRPDNIVEPDSRWFISDYIDENGNVTILYQNKSNKTYNSKEELQEDYKDNNKILYRIKKNNGSIQFIDIDNTSIGSFNGIASKLVFGKHNDVIAKLHNGTHDTYFCDIQAYPNIQGKAIIRSGDTRSMNGGISFMSGWYSSQTDSASYIGARLMFNGTDNTICIINND